MGASWTSRVNGGDAIDITSGHVAVAASPALNSIRDGVTVCARVRARSTSPGWGGIVTRQDISQDAPGADWRETYGLYVNQNTARFVTNEPDVLTFNTAVPLDQWVHLCATYDSATKQAVGYTNCVADGMATLQGTLNNQTNNPLIIGGNHNFGAANPVDENFPGSIDDVRVYNRVLGAAEVAQFCAPTTCVNGMAQGKVLVVGGKTGSGGQELAATLTLVQDLGATVLNGGQALIEPADGLTLAQVNDANSIIYNGLGRPWSSLTTCQTLLASAQAGKGVLLISDDISREIGHDTGNPNPLLRQCIEQLTRMRNETRVFPGQADVAGDGYDHPTKVFMNSADSVDVTNDYLTPKSFTYFGDIDTVELVDPPNTRRMGLATDFGSATLGDGPYYTTAMTAYETAGQGRVFVAGIQLFEQQPGLPSSDDAGRAVIKQVLANGLKWVTECPPPDGTGAPSLVVWRDYTTGNNRLWLLSGKFLKEEYALTPVANIDWAIKGVGDFNANGTQDILWHNKVTGESSIWYMPDFPSTPGAVWSPTSTAFVQIPPGFVPERSFDINGDGYEDIFVRYPGGTPLPPYGNTDLYDPDYATRPDLVRNAGGMVMMGPQGPGELKVIERTHYVTPDGQTIGGGSRPGYANQAVHNFGGPELRVTALENLGPLYPSVHFQYLPGFPQGIGPDGDTPRRETLAPPGLGVTNRNSSYAVLEASAASPFQELPRDRFYIGGIVGFGTAIPWIGGSTDALKDQFFYFDKVERTAFSTPVNVGFSRFIFPSAKQYVKRNGWPVKVPNGDWLPVARLNRGRTYP